MEKYLKALELYKEFPEAHQNIAHLFDINKDYYLSRYHHQLSIQYAHSNEFKTYAINNLILIELKLLETKEKNKLLSFLTLLHEADSLLPNQVDILYTTSIIYEMIGDNENSVVYLNKILSINPKHSLALLNLGNYYFRCNHHMNAIYFYLQAMNYLKRNDTFNLLLILNNLGQSYREIGQLNLSLDSFNNALTNITIEYESKILHFWTVNNVYTIKGRTYLILYIFYKITYTIYLKVDK